MMNRKGAILLVLGFLLAWGAPVFAAEGFFAGGNEVKWMKAHRSDDDFELQKSVLQEYFQSVKRELSDQRAFNYAVYVKDGAKQFEVDPFLVAALMISESDLEWKARDKNHYGLMMIEWDKHRKWIYRDYPNVKSLRILFKPVINVRVGTNILRDNLNKYHDDYDETIAMCYVRERIGFHERVYHHYRNLVTMYMEQKTKPKKIAPTYAPLPDEEGDD